MISWHKVGQKVAPVEGAEWPRAFGPDNLSCSMPEGGCVYEITALFWKEERVFFGLAGFPAWACFAASGFRPVYPQIIEDLRKLDVPVRDLERVKEDA